MKTTYTDTCITFELNSHEFSEAVITKTVYWLEENLSAEFNKRTETEFTLNIFPLKGTFQQGECESIVHEVRKGFMDFKLRDIVQNETKIVRELLIAKAFSHFE